MINVRLGYGCGLKVTLLTPAGSVCDLRKVVSISAVLRLPSGETMPADDISVDKVTNAVYVRLLENRELTKVGTYGIVFNVKLSDGVMYSTPMLDIVKVSETAEEGYQEITTTRYIVVTDLPENAERTGASPKISGRNTWLVYNDDTKAYEDSGVIVTADDYYTKAETDQKLTTLESETLIQSAPISIKNKALYKEGAYINSQGVEISSAYAYVSISVEQGVLSYIFNAVYTDRTYQVVKKKGGVVVGTYDSISYERQDIIVGEGGVTDLDCDTVIFNFDPAGGYEISEIRKIPINEAVKCDSFDNNITELAKYSEGYIKGDGTEVSGFAHLEIKVDKDYVKLTINAQFFSNGYPIIKYKNNAVVETVDLKSYERQDVIVGEGGVTNLDCDKIVFNIYPATYTLTAIKKQLVSEAIEELKEKVKDKETQISTYNKGHFFGVVPSANYTCLTEDVSFGAANTSYEQLIEQYNLVTDDISCKSIVIGQSCDGKDIRAYVLSAPENEYESEVFANRRPKIMIICGQHGFEKSSAYGSLYFLNDVINNNQKSPLLSYFKNNVDLIIVPCANPSGWNAMGYKNSNGVNLNRNWDNPKWNNSITDVNSDQYQGEAPFDQPETACIRDFILQNKDIDLFVDFHTNGGSVATSQGNINWIDVTTCGDEDEYYYNVIKEVVSFHAQNINGILRTNFDEQIGGDKTKTCSRLTYNNEMPSTGYADAYCITQGIIALTLEGNNGLPNETSAYSQYEKKANAMILGNFLTSFLGVYSAVKL